MSILSTLNQKIIFFDSSMTIDDIKDFSLDETIFFSFDYESHQLLSKNKIPHKISDEYVDKNDLYFIEKISMKLSHWYNESEISKLLIYFNINLGELFYVDTFNLCVNFLKKYLEIASISKSFSKSFFYTSTNLFPIINSFTDSVSEISNHSQNDLIEIPLKIGNVSLPFKLSKTNLSKLRKIPESLTRVIIRSKINTNNKTILVHNVTTERFSDFYLKIPDFPLNIVKYDDVIPAIWNYKTYKIIKKSGCVIENPSSLSNDILEKQISKSIDDFNSMFESLISKNHFFHTFFSINNSSFWDSFKLLFTKFCIKKFSECIRQIEIMRSFFNKYDFSAIMIWSEHRLEDQILYHFGKQNNIPVIFSQHGFEFDTDEMIDSMTFFRGFPYRSDFIIVWGDIMRNWFIKNGLDPKKIKSLGSPYFSKLSSTNFKIKNEYVLLACDAKAWDFKPEELCIKNILKYDQTIKNISEIIIGLDQNLVIKPHPSKIFNEKKIASEVDENIKVVTGGDIESLIPSCSVVITTNITTSILQALILKKPVILIRTNSYYGKPHVLKLNGCIEATLDTLESILIKLFSDKKYLDNTIEFGNDFISKYFSNSVNSSEEILKFLSEENF
jgi:UDP-N-acetylglucosamine transferase subunit ALG13